MENSSRAELELESGVGIFNKIYNNTAHIYNLNKEKSTDNMFLVEISPCNFDEVKLEILEQKESDNAKEKIIKDINIMRKNGKINVEIYPIKNANYLKITSTLSFQEEQKCKYQMFKDKSQQCKLDFTGGSEYWVKFNSVNKDNYRWNSISNNGKINLNLIYL